MNLFRYVQTVPVVFKKEIGNVSKILCTSTPKRRVNKSLPINDTSYVEKNKKNRSFNATCPTLENFITDSLLNSSKENLSFGSKGKRKKRGRNSNSPTKDSDKKFSTSCDLQKNDNDISFEVKNRSFDSKNKSFDTKTRSFDLKFVNIVESPNVLRSRRIKPTVLNQSTEKTVLGSNSFSFTQSNELDNFSWQRSILKEEKEKIASRTTDSIITVRRNPSKNFIPASPNLVTKSNILISLVQVYKTLIDFGYVLNPLTEFNFVLTLLLANGEEGMFCSDYEDIFESIHNCVYFAAKLLLEEVKFLQILNKSTLRLLSENNRVLEFVPELSKILNDFINLRPADITIGKLRTISATYILFNDKFRNLYST